MAAVIAHLTGRWSAWVVYLGPILFVGGWVALDRLRGRRRGVGEDAPAAHEPTG